MPDQFRTTISAVYWTATPEEGQAIADTANATLPDDAQEFTIVTIQYVADGKPDTSVPEPPPPEDAS